MVIVGAPTLAVEVVGRWQCKRKCTDDVACAGFTYDQNTRMCSLYEDDAEVEKVLPPISGFKEGNSLRCPAQATTVPTAPSTEDTNPCAPHMIYIGPVLSTLTDLHLNGQNGQAECGKRCDDHGDCAGYSWSIAEEQCALLKSVDLEVNDMGSYSGRKGCVQ